MISPAVNHRLSDYWGDDADEFRPERWSSRKDSPLKGDFESGMNEKAYGSFVPFSLGSRYFFIFSFESGNELLIFKLYLEIVLAGVLRSRNSKSCFPCF